jgi:F420-dependent oxidoreductase-like protein
VLFSIQTPQYKTDLGSLIDTWRVAEGLGFRSAWLMDHLYPILAPPTDPILEAWTTLAALATQTSAIRVGVLVSANTFRHPSLLARMAATIDQASGGRLEVGLGAAWCEAEHVEQGIDFPPLGERLTRLDEACSVLRGLWTEERFSFDGRYYRLRDAACAPKPVQARLPLLVGGQGERRALRIVASHADLWNLSGSCATLAQKKQVLARHCARVGRDPARIRVTLRNDFYLTEDRAVAERKIEQLARFARQSPEQAAQRVFVGGSEVLGGAFRDFAAAGAEEFILGLEPPYDGATHRMLERFARELMPGLVTAGTTSA